MNIPLYGFRLTLIVVCCRKGNLNTCIIYIYIYLGYLFSYNSLLAYATFFRAPAPLRVTEKVAFSPVLAFAVSDVMKASPV